ncbi:MAG: hypothetical protein KDE32_12430, partial [Novosphingobium sp.]|nr:hypothetical protein [Novosphingobium sp.]
MPCPISASWWTTTCRRSDDSAQTAIHFYSYIAVAQFSCHVGGDESSSRHARRRHGNGEDHQRPRRARTSRPFRRRHGRRAFAALADCAAVLPLRSARRRAGRVFLEHRARPGRARPRSDDPVRSALPRRSRRRGSAEAAFARPVRAALAGPLRPASAPPEVVDRYRRIFR